MTKPYVPEPAHTSNSYVADKSLEYNYDVKNGPKNKKLLLLTRGHVAILGCLYGDQRDEFILGWFPLPGQNKSAEADRLVQTWDTQRARDA